MEKYWDSAGNVPALIKESSHHFGQQAVKEALATRPHHRQDAAIPSVEYSVSRTRDGIPVRKCRACTSEKAELISADEIPESTKIPKDQSLYHAYIDPAVSHGIDRGRMQDYLDNRTLTDFLIRNIDEHLLNFGVLCDPESMQLVAPAPIFDSGSSMYDSDERIVPYSRAELLQRKITGFYQTEEKMLANVSN